jgi:hypothetical protein
MLTRENYYSYGSEEQKIIISNSSLSKLNPHEGGSWTKFINFIFGNTEEKESKSLERGKLLHQYIENPESFKVRPEDVPSEDVCRIVEQVRLTLIERGISTEGSLKDYSDMVVNCARANRFGAANWSSETILSKILAKGDAYFSFLNEADGSIMTDKETKKILDGLMQSLKIHSSFIQEDPKIVKEWPYLFNYNDDETLVCKMMVDNLIIDMDNKSISIRDIKTTSHPASLFGGGKILDPQSYPELKEIATTGPFHWFRVYRQLAFYELGVRSWLRSNNYNPDTFVFTHHVLVCETKEPYEVVYFPVTHPWIEAGKREIEFLMNIIKHNLIMETDGKSPNYSL